jgi:hypothetical protein
MAPITSQIEHAPTVDQCRADQRLWLSQLESGLPLPAVSIMDEQRGEMMDCLIVDPSRQLEYRNTTNEISAAVITRYRHFLWRHNLMDQFVKEDAAGKR